MNETFRTMHDLEQALLKVMPEGFYIDVDNNDQVIIYTGYIETTAWDDETDSAVIEKRG